MTSARVQLKQKSILMLFWEKTCQKSISSPVWPFPLRFFFIGSFMRFLTSLLLYWSWCQMWLCRHLRSLIYRSYESPLTTVWFVNQGGQLLNYVPLRSSSSIQVLQTAWLKLLSSAWFHLIFWTFPRSCLKGMHHAASPVIFLSNICIHFSALSLCKKKKRYITTVSL